MMDVPIAAFLEDSSCLRWRERQLHPDGLQCPHGRRQERRVFRQQGHCPAYRGRACDGYDPLLPGTVFEKTRQRPATLVLLLRGMAKGEPTARLARARGRSRTPRQTLRPRIQAHRHETAPTDVRMGTAFEADERSHNAGEPKPAAS